MSNCPARNTATPGATSYHATTARYTFGVWSRTSTATGSASGNVLGYVQAHAGAHAADDHEDAGKVVNHRATRRPLRARLGRASEPSSMDTLRRERPHQRRVGGWYTRWYTWCPHPPRSRAASAAQKGGSPPVLSLSAGAVRGVRSRTKNQNNDRETTPSGVGHPPRCFWYTPPSVCVPFCSTPAVTPIVTPERSRRRGHSGADQHNAASGLTNRIVLQIEYRSIAARRCFFVGAPSGSLCNHSSRSAALSNPPAARKR